MGVGRPMHPNTKPQELEVSLKEAELRTAQSEYARVLGRLAELPVNDATRLIVQRFTAGELTARQLDEAISRYLRAGR